MRVRLLAAVVSAWIVGAWAFASAAGSESRPVEASFARVAERAPERVVMIFIDSLSDRTANDARVMPELVALAREGVAFAVEPCRDRLTYLCVRAALAGRDESSLLALGKNFDHHPSAPDTVLHELAARGGNVIGVGSHDLEAYAATFSHTRYVERENESPARVVSAWAEMDAAFKPSVSFISLSNGDYTAHVYGTKSAEYRSAFRAIDAIVGEIAARRTPDTELVVFGDHGHDENGRHLPGAACTTFALYSGPAFRHARRAHLSITDHATLLSTLFGVRLLGPYTGPPLAQIFSADWVRARLGGRLPVPLQERVAGVAPQRMRSACILVALGLLSLWLSLFEFSRRALASAGVAFTLALIALVSGSYFDRIRLVIHDHGSTPARSLYLLLPLGLGFGIAGALRRRRVLRAAKSGAWLPTGTAAALLVVFLCLFPCAHYYGSSRALTYAAIAMLLAFAVDAARELAGGWRARLPLACATLFVIGALCTFMNVGQKGDSLVAPSFVLRSALYQGNAWLPFLLAKVVVFALLFATSPARRSLDSAGAASLLTVAALIALVHAGVPREFFAALALVLVLAFPLRRRAPMSYLCAGLLLLSHFYSEPVHLAPIEMLLAATSAALFAWRHSSMRDDSLAAADSLTLVTAAYLMLWPTLGFRLSGIDFRFMFAWVPAASYEKLWWIIALGTWLKFGLPYLLLGLVAEQYSVKRPAARAALAIWSAKVVLLSLVLCTYAVGHSTHSNLGTDMLAELALIVLALVWVAPALLCGSEQDTGHTRDQTGREQAADHRAEGEARDVSAALRS